jgi:hypothetical protein
MGTLRWRFSAFLTEMERRELASQFHAQQSDGDVNQASD